MLPSILVPLGLLCGIWVPVTGIAECQQRPPPLLLISFDGFRADYLQRFPMRNLKLLYSQGVLVEEMTNVFITKTFPNHYSLVTGLYAESHGILAGSMYDPISHKHFHVANGRDAMWWNEATPIWVSAHQAGYKTAVAMWPGSDVAIHNQTPTHFFPYSPDVSFRERLGNVTNWLLGNEKEEGVMFAALYWEEPDRSGHIFGPENTSAIGKVLEEVDDNIGLLMSELKRTGLWGRVNVLVTSDHGMAQCSADRLIRLDDCLHPDNYTLVDLTPVAALIPNNKPEAVFALLANCHSHMTAYLKEAIPESLHYRNNERIQPIILIADEGWTIIQRGNKLPRLGDHGYNNSLPSMHPFMAAWGPSFRNGYRLETLQSVDLYPLMCHLLALTPQPNNGTLVKARCMLVAECWQDGLALMGLVMGVLIVLATIPVLLKLMARRLRPSTSRAFRRVLVDHANDEEESLLE